MAKRPSNRLVRKAIREIMEPAIRDLGFDGKYPKFKRLYDREIHFLEIWTAKYGGSFSYSIGWCKQGALTHWDDAIIPEENIEMAHLPFENRASAHRMVDLWALDGTPLRCSDDIFDYSLCIADEAQCRDLVLEAAETLTEADTWLRTRKRHDAIWSSGEFPPIGWNLELAGQMSINKNEIRVRALGLLDD